MRKTKKVYVVAEDVKLRLKGIKEDVILGKGDKFVIVEGEEPDGDEKKEEDETGDKIDDQKEARRREWARRRSRREAHEEPDGDEMIESPTADVEYDGLNNKEIEAVEDDELKEARRRRFTLRKRTEAKKKEDDDDDLEEDDEPEEVKEARRTLKNYRREQVRKFRRSR